MSSIAPLSASTTASWLVLRLFGVDTNQQDGTPSAGLLPLPGVSLATTRAVSSRASDAFSKLSTGGNYATPNAQVEASLSPGGGLASGLLSTNQDIAIVKEANAMTSQQLSDAIYGSGVTVAGEANTIRTFADMMAMDRQTVSNLSQMAKDPTLSDAARQSASTAAQQIAAVASAEQTAYDNHTLVFQKASDVQGLDYQGTMTFTATDGNGNLPPQGAGVVDQSYNADFLLHNQDGKQHDMMDFGNGVQLFLTW